MDGDDVGMGEARRDAGLVEGLGQRRGGHARRGGERHALDGHPAFEPRVPADLHGAKAAGATGLHHAVATEQESLLGLGLHLV